MKVALALEGSRNNDFLQSQIIPTTVQPPHLTDSFLNRNVKIENFHCSSKKKKDYRLMVSRAVDAIIPGAQRSLIGTRGKKTATAIVFGGNRRPISCKLRLAMVIKISSWISLLGSSDCRTLHNEPRSRLIGPRATP